MVRALTLFVGLLTDNVIQARWLSLKLIEYLHDRLL